MTKNEAAQKLTYLVSEFGDICPPDEHFSAYCIGIKRHNAYKILDGLVELGMLPPFLPNKEHGYPHIDEDTGWEEE